MTASALRADIQALVDSFVGQLEELVRKAALETVTQLLQPGATSGRAPALPAASRRGVGRPARGAAPKAVAPKARNASKSGGRVRRSAEQIEAAGERIVKHVEGHAGAKAEEIRAALGLAKNEWTLTIKRLVDDGKLTTKGEKRATQYFAKGGGARLGVIKRPGRGADASSGG
jgi:hypothetical protein